MLMSHLMARDVTYQSLALAMNDLDNSEETTENTGSKTLVHHPIFYWKDGAMIFRVGF